MPRGYGRHDYERFDDSFSAHRVGNAKIGNVIVDCRFLFTKSQWGLIGNNMNPGGIVYLDLDFDQPVDMRFRSATVLVTLKEYEGKELRKSQRVQEPVGSSGNRSRCPVKFTHYYGPRQFHGPERSMRTHREKHLVPNVNIAGYGVGGVGVTSEQDSNQVSRWKFAGHLGISKGNTWYDRLRWTLEENELESQSLHSNILHTAFAIEHNANEFYMTVEVSGKLVSLSDRFKNKMRRFGGSECKGHETVTTKFQWTNAYFCPKRLDKLAEGLEYAMKYANLHEIPLEVPDTLPGQFRPMADIRDSVSESIFNSDGGSFESAWPGLSDIDTFSQGIETIPELDELARAAGFAPIASGPPDTTEISEPPAPTLVDSKRQERDNSGTKPMRRTVEASPRRSADDSKSEMETLIWLTRMPLIAVVLKFVAAVMGMKLEQLDHSTTADTDHGDKDGTMENARLWGYIPSTGRMNSHATGSSSSTLNGKSYVKRRNHTKIPSGLERIEEVSPTPQLNPEDGPERLTMDGSGLNTLNSIMREHKADVMTD